MSVAGIDFGSKSNVVALARRKGIDVVMNEESKRETPSLINFGDKCVGVSRLIFLIFQSRLVGFREKKERTDRRRHLNTLHAHAHTHAEREREKERVKRAREKKTHHASGALASRGSSCRCDRGEYRPLRWNVFECVGGDDDESRRFWKLPSSLFFLRRFVFFSFSILRDFSLRKRKKKEKREKCPHG